MIFGKMFELPIVRTYVAHWGLLEAVREILQNALDGDSPFEWSFRDNTLRVHSRYALLTPGMLLLGQTTKAHNNDAIGSFGEGFKIAMLVLTRMGYKVVIHNGKHDWKPEFRASNTFGGAETLHVVESKAAVANEGITFEVAGLSGGDIEAIRNTCLHMQKTLGEVVDGSKGRILLERPGELYVGGLFVCKTEMKHGYDMKPAFLRLERDRQTVSGFDLAMLTKDLWFESGRTADVVQLITQEAPDMEYANYGTPEVVADACYKHFLETNPGKFVAYSESELRDKVKSGMTNVVYVGGSYNSIVYHEQPILETIRVAPPVEILEAYLRNNRAEMRTKAIVSFKDIIELSKGWKS